MTCGDSGERGRKRGPASNPLGLNGIQKAALGILTDIRMFHDLSPISVADRHVAAVEISDQFLLPNTTRPLDDARGNKQTKPRTQT
ncbi:hypothetical protein ACRALDRAFT_209607 [Sodiomyces alcalophilus JCM 7366]|uniref:uncharacterized protein n=1 Tax=Sodiomyces alcalophilus JCM 7366 TaxID=591952 RepID=UPI0039B66A83